MTITKIELVRCNECEATFPADDLVMSQANNDHSIDDWHCPVCGGGDYDGVDADESIDSDFW